MRRGPEPPRRVPGGGWGGRGPQHGGSGGAVAMPSGNVGRVVSRSRVGWGNVARDAHEAGGFQVAVPTESGTERKDRILRLLFNQFGATPASMLIRGGG